MITTKQFIVILIFLFLSGFGIGLFVYHNIRTKHEPISIVKENVTLQYSFDSLLTEYKIKELSVFELKKQILVGNSLIDSLIVRNHKIGKEKNDKIKNFTTTQLIHWSDSVLRANKLK